MGAQNDDDDELRHAVELPPGDPGRRRFLKIATCALGGGIGAAVAVPAVRYLLDPIGRKVVASGAEPLDVIGLDQLVIGGPPVKVRLVAPSQRDGWSTVTDVPLGAAWVSRSRGDEVQALSTICPHLGCAVGFDEPSGNFRCPCHDSAFAPNGDRITGPAERGLDPLPVTVDAKTGRVRLTWVRYRQGGRERTPA